MTKKLRIKYRVLEVLSILLNAGPLLYFTIASLIQSEGIGTKLTLGCTVVVVLILSLVAWTNKLAMRSRLWVLLIGFWLCLEYFMPVLITIAACQVLDELVICPLKQHYKQRLTINKEIDKRQ